MQSLTHPDALALSARAAAEQEHLHSTKLRGSESTATVAAAAAEAALMILTTRADVRLMRIHSLIQEKQLRIPLQRAIWFPFLKFEEKSTLLSAAVVEETSQALPLLC